jgi:hypothetical protein
MTDKEKIKRIKKVLDNNGNDYWDDCGVMCDQIQSIVNEERASEQAEERASKQKK